MGKCKKCGKDLKDGEPVQKDSFNDSNDKKVKETEKTSNENNNAEIDSKEDIKTNKDVEQDKSTVVEIDYEKLKSDKSDVIDIKPDEIKEESSKQEKQKPKESTPQKEDNKSPSQKDSTYNEYEEMLKSNGKKREWFKKKSEVSEVIEKTKKQKRQIDSEKVMSVGGFFVNMLVLLIPIIGLIIAIVWAIGGAKNNNRVNMGKAYLAMFAVFLVVFIACGITLLSNGATVKSITYDIVDSSTNNFLSKHKIRSFNDLADVYYKLEHFDDFQKYLAEMDRKEQDKKDEENKIESQQKNEEPKQAQDVQTPNNDVNQGVTQQTQQAPPSPAINYYYYNNPAPQN